MKVHLRLDNSEDADPASSSPLGDLLTAADGVFSAALQELALPESLPEQAEVSVTLLSPEEMEEQNRIHRGLPEPTDVLSFPLWEEEGEFRPEKGMPVLPLGDIVICPEFVRKNAPSEAAFLEEMALMLAHGFLHLLAWDHDTDERTAAMDGAQEKLSRSLLAAAAKTGERGAKL